VYNTRNGKRPRVYDVLSCLQSYPVPTDVWDFADEFGYEISDRASYRRAERTCKACATQYKKLRRLFDEDDGIMDALASIC
jgi:hypothetical protein